MTISGTQSFASLDGSASDHDGSVNGVFTVNDGDLVVNGVVNCNDDGGGDNACAMAFAVSGNMSVGSGGALYAENRTGAGTGGAVTLTVGGSLSLTGNAVISTASRSSSGSTGGAITANVTGGISTAAGTTIDSGSANARGGAIALAAGGLVSIDGNVLSGPSRTLLATRLGGGAALDGGTSNSIGGAVTISSITFVEPALTVGPTANIVSQGADGGAGPVTLDGCGIVVKGLVAALSRKDGAASVRIRSGKDVLVDGRDLGVAGGTRLGRVRADAPTGTALNKGIDIFATETVDLFGPSGTSFLLTSLPGLHDSKSYGGTIRIVSVADAVNGSGNLIDDGHTASGDSGGSVDISAKGHVNLNTSVIRAVGDFNTNNSNRGGGVIRVRSYSGNVVWTNGTGEVRPVGSTSNLALAEQGSIVLTACGTVSTTGSTFPVMGVATSPLPETHTGVCSPAAPSLPTGVPPLVICNTPPVANDASAATHEDTSVTVTLSGTDADGDPLTFSIVSGPAHGSLGPIVPTGPTTATVTYTPALHFNGTDSFVYRANDGNGGTDDATVTVAVAAVNDPPSFLAGPTVVVLEDAGPQTFANWVSSISPGPADESTQSVTFTVTNSNPSLFLVQPAVSSSGTVTFTANANASGTATLTIVAQDNGGTANGGNDTSAPQSSSINVTAVNDAPSFIKGADQTVHEDAGPQSVSNWATGISAGPGEGSQTVSFVVTAATPSLFSAPPQVGSTGALTYTPAANANGSTTVTIHAKDNGGTANGGVDSSAPQTFVITIKAVNDAPSFVKGADQTVNEDAGAQTVAGWATSISAGPSDESGQNVHFLVTGNTKAALFSTPPAVAADGTLTYTPAADASGSATITVIAKDDGGIANDGVDTSDPQTFVITVNAVNDAPSFTAGGDVTVNEDSAAYSAAWATAISAGPNETDTLTFAVTGNSNPSLFASGPSIASDGTLSFTLAANQNGSASLTIVLTDDGGTANGGDDTSDAATFTITVNAVNDAPSFTGSGNVNVLEDSGAYSATWITASAAGPANESGQAVTFLVSNSNGALFSAPPAIDAAGVLTFTVAANASGSATVTVTAKDDGGTANGGVDTSNPQTTFTINVAAVNDAPSFTSGGNVTVNEDSGPYSAPWATNISAGPNEGGQALQFFVSNSNNALFAVQPALSASGVLSFTPAPNASGSATVTVYLQDNGGTANGGVNVSGTVTFVITVNEVSDPPLVVNESYETIGNTLLQVAGAQTHSPAVFVSGSVLSNDSDTDGPNPLSASFVAASPGAVVTMNPDGTFTYVPPPGATGTDSFTYAVSDGGASAVGTVTITIKSRVWYVKNNGGGSTGTSISPFTTLTAAQNASSTGDTVYVFTGDGTTSGQNSGYTFKNNQRLIGQGVQLTVPVSVNGGPNPTVLHAAGTRPRIGNSAAIGVLASNNGNIEVAGLDISAATDGISVAVGITAVGTTSLHDLGVVSAGSRGIVLSGTGTNTAGVTSASVVSTGNGLEVRGPHVVSVNGSSFTATAGNGVDVDAAGGTPTIAAFANNTIGGATVGDGVRIGTAKLDAVAGGALDAVSGGTTAIGTASDPVGGAGLVLSGSSGHLSFTTLASYANGHAAFVAGTGAFTGAAGTQLSSAGGTLSSTGNAAINASNATLGLTLANLASVGSAASGVALSGATGTLNAAGGALAHAAAADVNISGSDIAFIYGGTITDDLGQLVSISGSQGSYTFSGAITDGNDGDGAGISLTGNSGAAISFTGGVVLSTGTNPAFTATGSGTVTVTDPAGAASNKLTTTTGTALTVTNTVIGTAGLTFESISSNGAASGVVLSDTISAGTDGGLVVTGNGGSCTTAANCTGGAIQNTSGSGISLTNTANVSLTRMFVGHTGGSGVSAMGMRDETGGAKKTLEIVASRLTSPGDAMNEPALFFGRPALPGNNTGTIRIADSVIEQFVDHGLQAFNNSGSLRIEVAGTPSGITSSTSMFDDNDDSNGSTAIQVEAGGTAAVSLAVTGTMFNNIETGAVDARAVAAGSSLDLDLVGNVVRNGGGPDDFPSATGFQLINHPSGGSVTFDIQGNKVLDSSGDGIVLIGEGPMQGRIGGPNAADGNVLSGLTGDGIRLDTEQTTDGGADGFTWTVLVQNNTIGTDATFPGIGDDGIQVFNRDGTKTLNLTIDGNSIGNVATEAIRFFTDADQSDGANLPLNNVRVTNNAFSNLGVANAAFFQTQETARLCLHMSLTSFSGANKNIFLTQGGTGSLQITQSSVAALAAANPSSTASSAGTITFNGTCTNPALPSNP